MKDSRTVVMTSEMSAPFTRECKSYLHFRIQISCTNNSIRTFQESVIMYIFSHPYSQSWLVGFLSLFAPRS